jgi:hypothetical protein
MRGINQISAQILDAAMEMHSALGQGCCKARFTSKTASSGWHLRVPPRPSAVKPTTKEGKLARLYHVPLVGSSCPGSWLKRCAIRAALHFAYASAATATFAVGASTSSRLFQKYTARTMAITPRARPNSLAT